MFKGKEFTFAREWRRRKVLQGLVFKAWLRSRKSWSLSLPVTKNWLGYLNTILAPGGGNLNKPIFLFKGTFQSTGGPSYSCEMIILRNNQIRVMTKLLEFVWEYLPPLLWIKKKAKNPSSKWLGGHKSDAESKHICCSFISIHYRLNLPRGTDAKPQFAKKISSLDVPNGLRTIPR